MACDNSLLHYNNYYLEMVKKQKEQKPVMEKLVCVLKDNTKGLTLNEIKGKCLQLPSGPALINGQWTW